MNPKPRSALPAKTIEKKSVLKVITNQEASSSTTSNMATLPKETSVQPMKLSDVVFECKKRLQHGEMSNKLLGRNDEFKEILGFVRNCITTRAGANLYVCGLPGQGKTQTVRFAAFHMKSDECEISRSAHILYIQGTSQPTSKDMLESIAEKITEELEDGEEVKSKDLCDYFLGFANATSQWHGQKATVIIVEEIQRAPKECVRTLLSMSQKQGSSLIVIGVTNDLNYSATAQHFEYEGFSSKIRRDDGSEELPADFEYRLRTKTLSFVPYNKEQLLAVLKEKTLGLFEERAMDVVSKHTLSHEGSLLIFVISLTIVTISRQGICECCSI